MNLEEKLVSDLAKNEQVVQIVPSDELQLEWKTVKDPMKTGAGYVAPLLDSVTAAKILNELGFSTKKVIVKQYAGKQYVIFKGYPGLRKIFKGTRYLASNPTVVRMAIGPKGIIKSAKGGFVVTAVLSVGIEVFDYFIRDNRALSDLLGTVTADLVKIGLSAIAAAAAGLAVGTATVIGTAAAAPLIAAIAVGIATGLILDKIDKRFGATNALIQAYEKMGANLREIEYQVNRHINYLESNPHLIPCLFGPCSIGRYY